MPTEVLPQGSEPAAGTILAARATTAPRPLLQAEPVSAAAAAAEGDAKLRLRAVRKLLLAAQRLIGETGEEEGGGREEEGDSPSPRNGERIFQNVQRAPGTADRVSVPSPSSPAASTEEASPRFVENDGDDSGNEQGGSEKPQMSLRELSDEIALLLAEGV